MRAAAPGGRGTDARRRYSWRFQLARFGGSEYTAVAFDTRGYGQSSKPAGVEAYKIDTLVEDLRSLVAALGFASCILVGHDWGGSVVWNTAARYPDLVDKLVVCNCPHPRCFRRTGRQLLRSWYIFFHQWPALPEWTYEFNDFRVVDEVQAPIARAWNDAGERVKAMLSGEPGIRLQPTPFERRVSYWYEPAELETATLDKIAAAGFDWLLSADTFLDVLPKGVAKGPTLLQLVETLNLPADRVLVAGDTLNDLSLFETGLKGVAVGNSEPRLVEQLTDKPWVYRSTGHGAAGIAEAIRHFGLD